MNTEQLTPKEMDTHIENGTFRLAFVGMSNAGKSYRSKKLRAQKDFLWYHVDGEIQKELGFKNMGDISKWIGYPSDPQYEENEAKYLELENEKTQCAAMQTNGKNLVFDTTGSVVHLKDKTLKILKENCLVVHLDCGDDSLEELIEKFFAHPKPVSWAGHFSQVAGESTEEALRRCYPSLLEYRLEHYRKLAHITFPAEEVRDTSAEETLGTIKSYL